MKSIPLLRLEALCPPGLTKAWKDRIIQLSYIKVYPDGHEERVNHLINPEVHILPEITQLTGISDDDVKDQPTFRQLAKTLADKFQGCDFAGFNSNYFDVPLLAEEFLRAGVDIDLSRHRFIDVQVIFHKMEQRTLTAAYKFYCGKDLTDAHSADGDTRATYEVLMAQLDRYPDDLKNDMGFLSEFSSFTRNVDFAGRIVRNDKDQEVFNFGKYKDMPVVEVMISLRVLMKVSS